MKYFSTFSGIGGFEIGIQRADKDAEIVGHSEIDSYAEAIYHYNFKGARNYGDITKIIGEELPDFDCLVGGFPCQAFSIAGRRRGFADTRGTLFFDLARILRTKKPRLFIFENVKGLLNHDGGRTFKTIIATVTELGYDVQWQVLNSKNFGVPQNRERVIIIGNLRGTPRPKVFPFAEDSQQTTGRIKQIIGGSQGYRVYDPNGISTTLASEAGGLGAKTGLYAVPVLTPDRLNKRQNGRRFKEPEDPSFTLTTQDRQGVALCSATAWREIKFRDYAPTMTATNFKHPLAVTTDGITIRKLTPTECERLQGFPDGWTEKGLFGNEEREISDSRRYKALGNAVTTNVIEAVVRKIVATK